MELNTTYFTFLTILHVVAHPRPQTSLLSSSPLLWWPTLSTPLPPAGNTYIQWKRLVTQLLERPCLSDHILFLPAPSLVAGNNPILKHIKGGVIKFLWEWGQTAVNLVKSCSDKSLQMIFLALLKFWDSFCRCAPPGAFLPKIQPLWVPHYHLQLPILWKYWVSF